MQTAFAVSLPCAQLAVSQSGSQAVRQSGVFTVSASPSLSLSHALPSPLIVNDADGDNKNNNNSNNHRNKAPNNQLAIFFYIQMYVEIL